MLHPFFQKHQILLLLIGIGLLVLAGWLWLSTPQPTPKAVDGTVPQMPTSRQGSETGNLSKSLKRSPPPQRQSHSRSPGQPLPFTRPLSDEEARKIEEMTARLMANGPFTEEQYRIERAKVLTEGLDSLSAVKLLERLGEHHKSIAEYAKKAYADNPNNPETLLYWSSTLESQEEKNAVYRRVLEIDPNSATALLRLGRNLAADNPHAAIEYLTKVEHLQNPLAPTPYTDLALAYQKIGEYDKALNAYRKGYDRNPHSDRAPFIRKQIEDLEAGIYKVPLWSPEEAETGIPETQTPVTSDDFIPETPFSTETDVTHTPEDATATRDTETSTMDAKGDLDIQAFFKNMSDAQLAEFEKFIANEYPELLEQSHSEQSQETQRGERFSPERLSRAMQTLAQYGPEEGILRLKKADPEVAKQVERLFLKQQKDR